MNARKFAAFFTLFFVSQYGMAEGVGTALPLEISSIAAIGIVSLIIAVQLVKRRK